DRAVGATAIETLEKEQAYVVDLDLLLARLARQCRIVKRDLDDPRAIRNDVAQPVYDFASVGRNPLQVSSFSVHQWLNSLLRRTHHIAVLDGIFVADRDLGLIALADVLAVLCATTATRCRAPADS